MKNLEDALMSDLQPTSPVSGALFLAGLKKLAAGITEEAANNEMQYQADMAQGTEPTPAEGEAIYQAESPDASGHMEGEFAVPVEEAVLTMSQLVSHKVKAQLAYLYYAETMRGLGRGELSELFEELSKGDAKDISYFMRRISVLAPGGVPVPVAPTPTPATEPEEILRIALTIEQQGIVLLKLLRSQMGDSPMKFTVEEMLSEEQRHEDLLWQYMPAAQKATKKKAKTAAALQIAQQKLAADNVPKPGPNAVVVPPAGSEPIEATLLREQQLALAQAQAERDHVMGQAKALQDQLLLTSTQAESLQAENQMQQDQMMQIQQQADQANMVAQQSQQDAAMHAENAAQQANAKMRLAMRIQQFRQQLAELIAPDPVQEEGVGFGEEAGPGQPVTTGQMAQEQAMAEQQQAQQPAKKSPSKPKPKETSKAAGFVDAAKKTLHGVKGRAQAAVGDFAAEASRRAAQEATKAAPEAAEHTGRNLAKGLMESPELRRGAKIVGGVGGGALALHEGHSALQGHKTRKSNRQLREAVEANTRAHGK